MNVKELFSIEGRVALVTGGAGMYGRQLVTGMVEAGARVFVASRNLAALEKLAAEYRSQGADITALAYDQGDETSILALRDEIRRRAGRCDILVNNSVLRSMMKAGYRDEAATFDESMRVNATGLFVITRAFGDLMAEQGKGSIINIGSIHGMIAPNPWLYEGTNVSGWYPDYFFHKAGMINFTRFVASYYGDKGVRCNVVSPGGYQTEKHSPRFLQNYGRATMLGRMATDDDLKGVVVFLASDAAGYITGANLAVDAGYTAK
jgi:NAD(P)-dependent dehydrogenase (short-subunit alcohol dehydrogenase family)